MKQEYSTLTISEKYNEAFNNKNFIPSSFSIDPVMPQILYYLTEQIQEQWAVGDYYKNTNKCEFCIKMPKIMVNEFATILILSGFMRGSISFVIQ